MMETWRKLSVSMWIVGLLAVTASVLGLGCSNSADSLEIGINATEAAELFDPGDQVEVEAENNVVLLSWKWSGVFLAATYVVSRRATTEESEIRVAEVPDSGEQSRRNTYEDHDVESGMTYVYTIRALSADGVEYSLWIESDEVTVP